VREVRRDIARLKTVAAQKRAGTAVSKPASTEKPAPAGKKSAAKSKRATRSKAKAE
jgi:hypothetical protein